MHDGTEVWPFSYWAGFRKRRATDSPRPVVGPSFLIRGFGFRRLKFRNCITRIVAIEEDGFRADFRIEVRLTDVLVELIVEERV